MAGAVPAARSGDWGAIVPRSGRPFVKMQGLGNHFVIVDGRTAPWRPDMATVRRIADVATGVGCDEIVIVEPPSREGAAAGAYVFMRIINIDGRDVEACGNATRCLGWLLTAETGRDEVIIETVAGPLACARDGDLQMRVAMGAISTGWQDIPLAHAVDSLHLPVGNGPLQDGVALNIGNPHAVYFVDDPDRIDLAALAEPISRNALFPQGVNVGAAALCGSDHLRLRVYERPGILTNACGSGACAAARAAQLRGFSTASRFTVEMPAGAMQIDLDEAGHAVMTGPVAYCFSGILAD